MDRETTTKTPWEFRLRVFVIFLAFGGGFFFGYLLQTLLFRDVTPTFVLIGRNFGDGGVVVAAYVAAAFAVAAWLIRLWASSYHSSGVVMSSEVITGTFTAAGPYRYVRNPLYFGNVLLTLGIGALGPPIATILVFAFNLAFLYRLIAIEERFLRAAEGDAYAAYCKTVPRLLPRLTPAPLPADSRKPDVMRGFLTELSMFGFAVAMLYSANQVRVGQDPDVGWTFWSIVGMSIAVQSLFRSSARGADA